MRNISINNYNLDLTNDIVVKKLEHDSMPIRDFTLQELARRDKAMIVSSQYTPKKIIIEGQIKGDNMDDLEVNIDTFKKSIAGTSITFAIQYASGTRNYTVALSSFTISRESFHINYVPFTLELTATDPMGYGTSYTKSWDGVTTSEYDCTFTALGSVYPEPIITVTINTETNMGLLKIKNVTTGDEIQLSMDYTAGDEIVLSMITDSFTVNGTAVDFAGKIPEFVTGENKLTATFTGDARNIDMDLTYQAKYL